MVSSKVTDLLEGYKLKVKYSLELKPDIYSLGYFGFYLESDDEDDDAKSKIKESLKDQRRGSEEEEQRRDQMIERIVKNTKKKMRMSRNVKNLFRCLMSAVL